MKHPKKSLQKFTKSELKINSLLQKDVILKSDTAKLNYNERKKISAIIQEKINSSMGIERDNYIRKFEDIINDDVKNQLWEINQSFITNTISVLMQEYGRMPTIQEISIKCELSRTTVYKHLQEYKNSPIHKEQLANFQFMSSKVLARVYYYAVNGDMQAAKLYFNMVGQLNENTSTKPSIIQNLNNYIQINNTVIDQEKIKQLNAEQLSQIEAIIKNVPYLIKKI